MMSKQDKERHYFELLRKIFPLPDGTVEYGDKPDVVITGSRRFGIEITNFYRENGSAIESEQRQASRRLAVASRAQEIYLQNGGKNIALRLNFNASHPIEGTEAVAQSVAKFVAGIDDRNTGMVPRHLHKHILELKSVYVIRLLQCPPDYVDPKFPDGQPGPGAGFAEYRNRREAQAIKEGHYTPLNWDAKWQVMQVHSFGLMDVDRLTEIVREKERKAKNYRPCDAYWLLVIVESADAAQEQEIRVANLSIHSGEFERVIIYKPNFYVVVLRTEKR